MNTSVSPASTAKPLPTSPLERRLRLQIPHSEIARLTQRRLQQIAQSTRLPGYRPGKVPLTVVARQHGDQARKEATQEAMWHAFQQQAREQQLRPAGRLNFEALPSSSVDNLQMEAVFEILPSIELRDVKDMQVREPQVTVSDADVEQALTNMRNNQTVYQPVQRPAQMGDEVQLNGRFHLPEESEDKAEDAKGLRVMLKETTTAELLQALTGAAVNDHRTVQIQYPVGGTHSRFAGKAVMADLQVTAVREPVVPALDETFAEQLGVADGSLTVLRQKVRETLEREVQLMSRRHVTAQIMEGLLAKHDIQAPLGMVDDEMAVLRENAHRDLASMGLEADPAAEKADHLRAVAERRVKLGLLFSELSRAHNLQPTAQQVMQSVHAALATHPQRNELERKILADEDERNRYATMVMEHNVVDWVKNQLTFEKYSTTLMALSDEVHGAQGISTQ